MHFVNTFQKPQGDWSLSDYSDYMDDLHRGTTTIDAFMNNRVQLFHSDLDDVVTKLQKGSQEVRAFANQDGTYSVMALVPTGIIIELVGDLTDDTLGSIDVNEWAYCSLESASHSLASSRRLASTHLDLDGVWPLAAVYAVSDGNASASFFTEVLSASLNSEAKSDDECADIYILDLPGTEAQLNYTYQIILVDAPTSSSGSMSVSDYENYLFNLHGDIQNLDNDHYDSYMDNHIGLYIPSGDEIISKLEALNIPFFTRCNGGSTCYANVTNAESFEGDDFTADVFIQVADTGIIYEVLGPVSEDILEQGYTQWDLCGPNYI